MRRAVCCDLAWVVAAVAGAVLSLLSPASGETRHRYLTVASAEPGGVYHRRALDLCVQINAACASTGPRCVVEPTEGSGQNLELLGFEEVDFAIVQSDIASARSAGSFCPVPLCRGAECDDAGSALVAATLYQEALFVVARDPDSSHWLYTVDTLDDLNGRVVSLGAEGSGTRVFADKVLKAASIDFGRARALSFAQGLNALCAGELDAVFRVIDEAWGARSDHRLGGIPTPCPVRLLAVDAPVLRRLLDVEPTARPVANIGSGWPTGPVASVGPAAVLVARAELCDRRDAVVELVRRAATIVRNESIPARLPSKALRAYCRSIAEAKTPTGAEHSSPREAIPRSAAIKP